MKSVGLRELKNNLSRYVRHVRAGEALAITDRGEVIAELLPPHCDKDPASVKQDMLRRGELRPGTALTKKEREALYGRRHEPLLKGMTAQQLLDDLRGER